LIYTISLYSPFIGIVIGIAELIQPGIALELSIGGIIGFVALGTLLGVVTLMIRDTEDE
jgi:hypothetical protein